SLHINCADQAEVDYYWDKLTDGGEEVQCGWLKDRYGLSWQVGPDGLGDALARDDPGGAGAANKAMLGNQKPQRAAPPAAAAGDIPHRPTIWRAMRVACSRSLSAPVETSP